jgi:hypothetical protein
MGEREEDATSSVLEQPFGDHPAPVPVPADED